jgi:hypothetical protein
MSSELEKLLKRQGNHDQDEREATRVEEKDGKKARLLRERQGRRVVGVW